MRSLVFIALTLILAVGAATVVNAQTEVQLNFQGRLLSASGAPINTSTAVTFRVYRGGNQFIAGSGVLLYEETANITPDGTGIFNHAIGAGTPNPSGDFLQASDLNTTDFMFVEVSIGGNALLPRTSLVSGAYAAVANLANNAENLGGIAAAGYLTSPLTSAEIGAGTIVAANLAQGSVTSFAISNESITGADVLNGSLTGFDIANGTVTSDDIENNSITGADILNETITSADILNGTIQGTDLATGAITTTQVLDGTLTGADIQNGSIEPGDLLPSGNYTLTGNLSAANLTSTANTILGDAAGDALTINAGTIVITNAVLSDAQISDTLTVGPAGSVDDAALSPAVSLLGQTIELGTEVSGELAITAVAVPGETAGDILFYDGSDWTRVAAGSAGQLLQTQGASASPPLWVDSVDTQSRLFQTTSLATSDPGTDLTIPGTTLDGLAMSLPGSVTGLAVTLSGIVTAGQATFEVTLNGSGTGLAVDLGSSDSQGVVSQLASPPAIAQGDVLGVRVTTDGSYAPSGTLDAIADVITSH